MKVRSLWKRDVSGTRTRLNDLVRGGEGGREGKGEGESHGGGERGREKDGEMYWYAQQNTQQVYKHSKHTSIINSAVNKAQLNPVMCGRGGGQMERGEEE